jgi:hypothetical protein
MTDLILTDVAFVFRNVFCRDDADLEVAGMSALFRSLVGEGEGGVEGWHYVVSHRYTLRLSPAPFVTLSLSSLMHPD